MPSPSLQFPSTSLQVLSSVIHFVGVSLLAHCLSRRLASESLLTRDGWSQLSWPRACLILVFLDSWLFLFSSGVLIFGVGLESHLGICSGAIYLCIVFYSTSKLLIYAFLIERVYVVWAPAAGSKRFRSPVYIICVVTVSAYAAVIGLLLGGRIYQFDKVGTDAVQCVIGLKMFASLPLLSYDIYINIFLTALFLTPLIKSATVNPRLRRAARRALVASSIALTTSTANIVILAVLDGTELGWVCLGSCGADVIINALVIFWATSGKRSDVDHRHHSSTITQGTMKNINENRSVQFVEPTTPHRLSASIAYQPADPNPVYTAGPRRMPYLNTQGGSQMASMSSSTSSERIPSPASPSRKLDPYHPFAPASYMPRHPQPTVSISVGQQHERMAVEETTPTKSKAEPSAMRSLINLFKPENKAEKERQEELRVTITTQTGVEVEYELEEYHDEEESVVDDRPPSRAFSV